MTEEISGKILTLRPATLNDQKPIFDWLTKSDLTNHMMGPPTYPDSKIPTWEEFTDDYKEYFFDSSEPLLGRCFVVEVNSEPVGQINHDKIYPPDNTTELDIWLKSSKYTGRGFGTDAIITLCNYLTKEFGCKKFFISPSRRNITAIKTYKKAGFIETNEMHENSIPDYVDTVVMIKKVL
jgi:RimJ/RimL family protein N-acetyltransferase